MRGQRGVAPDSPEGQQGAIEYFVRTSRRGSAYLRVSFVGLAGSLDRGNEPIEGKRPERCGVDPVYLPLERLFTSSWSRQDIYLGPSMSPLCPSVALVIVPPFSLDLLQTQDEAREA